MRMRVEATGPASRAAMWSAYADPTQWSTWAPRAALGRLVRLGEDSAR